MVQSGAPSSPFGWANLGVFALIFFWTSEVGTASPCIAPLDTPQEPFIPFFKAA